MCNDEIKDEFWVLARPLLYLGAEEKKSKAVPLLQGGHDVQQRFDHHAPRMCQEGWSCRRSHAVPGAKDALGLERLARRAQQGDPRNRHEDVELWDRVGIEPQV